MAPKAHPTTIRLTEEDQTFLASLKIAGATTISDKIRALLEDKRLQQQAGHDYRSSLILADSLMNPILDAVKIAEKRHMVHSQLVRRLIEWTPEWLANLMADGTEHNGKELNKAELEHLEQALIEQISRLVDTALQSYLARDTALYNADNFSEHRLAPLRRLCRIVDEESQNNTEGDIS